MTLAVFSRRTAQRLAKKPWLATSMASALLVTVVSTPAGAINWDGGAGADTSWSNPLNWEGDIAPSSSDSAVFGAINATATITNSPATWDIVSFLQLGATLNWQPASNPGVTQTLNVGTNAKVYVIGQAYLGQNGGFDIPSNITTNVTNNAQFYVQDAAYFGGNGNYPGGLMTLNVADTALFSVQSIAGAYRGSTFVVNQSGNSVVETIGSPVPTGDENRGGLSLGYGGHNFESSLTADCYATYNMSGGTLNLNARLILASNVNLTTNTHATVVHAEFNQTGGTVNVGKTMGAHEYNVYALAVTAERTYRDFKGSNEAVYKLYGGTLNVRGNVGMGMSDNFDSTYSGSGTFEFGNASGTGTFRQDGGLGGIARDVMVRKVTDSDGTFVGYGDVQFTGVLTNNGRVIADGYGTSRTLDMSHFATIANTIENGAAGQAQNKDISGWYAVNKGKLVLPGVVVSNSAGTFVHNWGEDAADTDIDLVNSLRMTMTKDATVGTQTINVALLATDHAEVLNLPTNNKVIGLWDITPTFALSSETAATIIFRYDDAKAASLSLDESALALYHYNSGNSTWEEITTGVSIDTTKNQLTATGLTDFSQYLIGELVSAPALLGDTNNDGVVDVTDFNNVQNNFGATGNPVLGDTNNDGVVDVTDFNNVQNNFGAVASTSLAMGEVGSVVPEPASLGLLAIGSLMILGFRGRGRRA